MKSKIITEVAAQLMSEQPSDEQWHIFSLSPSVDKLNEIVKLTTEVVFPKYLIESDPEMMNHHIVLNLEKVYGMLKDQIKRVFIFKGVADPEHEAEGVTAQFISSIAQIKELLESDVEAIYRADPAASSYLEIILCYPSVLAMTHYRIAHKLHKLGVPILPRVISEQAHFKSGIDIHPGATIGSHFAIDHGTGVVIGETTIIGKNVVVYQGVTLGARGFRFDENGNPINLPRHPIIEDNVRIYSNSSILGRITIGHDAVIGGNMWIDKDVEPHASIVKAR